MNATRGTGLSMLLCTALVLAVALFSIEDAQAEKKVDAPQETPQGLKLVTNTAHRLVYLADDADLHQYTRVWIIDCAVAFEKNWQRNYNRHERSLDLKVSDKDMERIKSDLAAEFRKQFTKVMTARGYEVVSEAAPDVMIIRPAIINLQVTAPDTRSATRTQTYVASAGQMTLYMELYDSVSGAQLAIVEDAKDAGRGMPMMMASRVSNIAAADRMLNSWANELADHLGDVHGEAKADVTE